MPTWPQGEVKTYTHPAIRLSNVIWDSSHLRSLCFQRNKTFFCQLKLYTYFKLGGSLWVTRGSIDDLLAQFRPTLLTNGPKQQRFYTLSRENMQDVQTGFFINFLISQMKAENFSQLITLNNFFNWMKNFEDVLCCRQLAMKSKIVFTHFPWVHLEATSTSCVRPVTSFVLPQHSSGNVFCANFIHDRSKFSKHFLVERKD